jgi:hypothetical protein
MKDDIVAVIVKIAFGDKSGVLPETYLSSLKNDEWNGWGTPSKYKYLDGKERKLILYDPLRKALTAEVEIKKVVFQKSAKDFPWRNRFSPGTLRVYRVPVPVERVRAVKGLENFSVYRKDRTSHRNVTSAQYVALLPGASSSETAVAAEQKRIEKKGDYAPKDAKEGRKQVWRSIALRRGQQRFRNNLLWAYGGQCCVTGTASKQVLEAAHIQPYADSGTNSAKNGLLLRSDIHVLFDLNLLSIDPKRRVVFCSKKLRTKAAYAWVHGRKVHFPVRTEFSPDLKLLKKHFDLTRA